MSCDKHTTEPPAPAGMGCLYCELEWRRGEQAEQISRRVEEREFIGRQIDRAKQAEAEVKELDATLHEYEINAEEGNKAYAKLKAEVERLRNPNAVNCDGLHADGSRPNRQHKPISFIRDAGCPACDAMAEVERLRAELNGTRGASSRCDRCGISPPATEARYVCPDCAAKVEAEVEELRAENEWFKATMLEALKEKKAWAHDLARALEGRP